MGRAQDIFDRIVQLGERAIDDLITDRQSEELFLDFKRSADDGKGSKLHQRDRENLAKAISGFGNSEGGVIIWGIDCREDPKHGDLPQFKVPIQNPRRFVSRLESAVSGCTIPAHARVRHHAVQSTTADSGFVVTHIPESHLAPHQAVGHWRYYIRAGSDFSPAPHGVLSGLFGRRPHAVVFPNWIVTLPQLQADGVITVGIGFALYNEGPVIAREVYTSVSVHRPRGQSRIFVENNEPSNWSNNRTLDHMTHFLANESFRLAPGAIAQPFTMHFHLKPPFESELSYEISYGHQNGQMQKLSTTVEPEKIRQEYTLFVSGSSEPTDQTGRAFMKEVFPLPLSDERKDF